MRFAMDPIVLDVGWVLYQAGKRLANKLTQVDGVALRMVGEGLSP